MLGDHLVPELEGLVVPPLFVGGVAGGQQARGSLVGEEGGQAPPCSVSNRREHPRQHVGLLPQGLLRGLGVPRREEEIQRDATLGVGRVLELFVAEVEERRLPAEHVVQFLDALQRPRCSREQLFLQAAQALERLLCLRQLARPHVALAQLRPALVAGVGAEPLVSAVREHRRLALPHLPRHPEAPGRQPRVLHAQAPLGEVGVVEGGLFLPDQLSELACAFLAGLVPRGRQVGRQWAVEEAERPAVAAAGGQHCRVAPAVPERAQMAHVAGQGPDGVLPAEACAHKRRERQAKCGELSAHESPFRRRGAASFPGLPPFCPGSSCAL